MEPTESYPPLTALPPMPSPPLVYSATLNHAEKGAYIAVTYVPLEAEYQRDMALSMRRMAAAMETLAAKLFQAGGG